MKNTKRVNDASKILSVTKLTYYFIFYTALRVNMIGTIVFTSVFGLLAIWFTCFYIVADFMNELGDFDLSTEELSDDCSKGLRFLRFDK